MVRVIDQKGNEQITPRLGQIKSNSVIEGPPVVGEFLNQIQILFHNSLITVMHLFLRKLSSI